MSYIPFSLSNFFGDGSDGSPVFDGSTTILGIVPSGNVYTLTRDLVCVNMTVNNGVTIKTNGYYIFGTGILTNNGTIQNNGGNASGLTAGVGATNQYCFDADTGATGVPGISIGQNPSAGTRVIGGKGGNGGAGNAQAGGTGGNNTLADPTDYNSGIITPHIAITNFFAGSIFAITELNYNSANSGASGGSDNASRTSGGGGGGAGWLFIAFKTILNGSGTIRCNGGLGGNATGSAGNAGGGGGGGGGVLGLYYHNLQTGTEQANGGAGGTHLGASGVDGVAGGAGKVLKFQV